MSQCNELNELEQQALAAYLRPSMAIKIRTESSLLLLPFQQLPKGHKIRGGGSILSRRLLSSSTTALRYRWLRIIRDKLFIFT